MKPTTNYLKVFFIKACTSVTKFKSKATEVILLNPFSTVNCSKQSCTEPKHKALFENVMAV